LSHRAAWIFACVALVAAAAAAGEPDPHLAPLLPFVGKTWRGAFEGAPGAKPVVDVHRFELALGGRAVRSSHSINDGDYGGEALFTFDAEKKAIVYTYVTTGGFYTTGVIEADAGGGFKAHEIVHGSASGPSEVEATSRILPDGRWHVKSRYLKDGKWADGHEVFYSEDPKAVVKFKD
jgi:hypothetical protein